MKKAERGPGREDCLAMARNCLSANLRKTERLVTRHYDEHLASAGVTAVQLPMLSIIAAAPEPTFRTLSEQLDVDRSTLSRNLALLRKKGLIRIAPSSGPKPGPITLTPKGRETLARAHRQWLAAQRELEAALSNEMLSEGLGFLKRLRGRVRAAAEK